MTPLLPLFIAITAFGGQITPSDQRADRALVSFEEQLAVFQHAQADFDAAVAFGSHVLPEAQRLYRQALSGYLSLINSGTDNGLLHYNVANTYLRLGEVGKAIVHYRRALRLLPGDENIRKNLAVARNLCEVQIPQTATGTVLETLFFWHFGTPRTVRTKVVLAGYVVFWMLLLLRLFARSRPPALAWAIRVAAALTLVVGASVTWDRVVTAHRREGVLVADEVVLRKGNGAYYQPQLDRPLSEGVEFRLLESREDVEGRVWYHVMLRDGKAGWLRSEQSDLI